MSCAPTCCGGENICGDAEDAPSDDLVQRAMIATFTMGRHPSVREVAGYFSWAHLPKGPLREASKACGQLAWTMIASLPDTPQLTLGLHDLLRAKDCFVRAALQLDVPHGGD